MFDTSNFNFDEDFSNLLNKKKFNTYIERDLESWKLELIEKWKKYEEWSPNFNTYIYMFYLPTFSYFKRNNK
jgi:hypothetical protein